VTLRPQTRDRKDDRMLGTMLWFNVEKGYGFIRTEQRERVAPEEPERARLRTPRSGRSLW
jgi:cold shock CspA family protein